MEEQVKEVQKEKTVREIIAEVQSEICDKYCRYPRTYNSEDWEKIQEVICNQCPLNKL